jgi:hypothetical protein
VETNCPPSPPQPPPSTEELPLLDIDKLTAESDGLYRQWWIMWKRNHPETCLITRHEPEFPPLLKYLLNSSISNCHVRDAVIPGHQGVKSLLSSVRNAIHRTGIGRGRKYENYIYTRI